MALFIKIKFLQISATIPFELEDSISKDTLMLPRILPAFIVSK